MHELSIAVSLVEMASQEVRRLGACRVQALHLRIGPFAGIDAEALRFSFGLAAADTPLGDAQLVIEDVPIVAYCPTCDAQQQIESPQQLTCPACGTPTPSLIHGSELELFAMEIADDAAANR